MRTSALVVALAAALLGHAPAAPAQETGLKVEMAALARQVQAEVEKYGGSAILGEFVGPPGLAATGGPGIARALKVELEKLGVAIRRSAEVAVTGEYRIVTDNKSGKTTMAVMARLVDRSGKELVEFQSRAVFDLAAIASATGATMVAPVGVNDRQREEAVDRALKVIQKPATKGTRIAASPDSPYALEILVGPDPGDAPPDLSRYRPRAASIDGDDLAFLAIARGEVYAVRVINESKHDAAVTLTIDGLSMFAFGDNPSYEFFILPAGAATVIPGWYRTNAISDAFQVAGYARSAAAEKLPSSASIGTIHASFRAAWPKGQAPPTDEGLAGARSGVATARGPAIQAKYAEVVREVGKLREAVGVRYDKAADPTDLPDSKPPR